MSLKEEIGKYVERARLEYMNIQQAMEIIKKNKDKAYSIGDTYLNKFYNRIRNIDSTIIHDMSDIGVTHRTHKFYALKWWSLQYIEVDLNDTHITISGDFNNSCQCHAEYVTITISLPINWIELNDSDLILVIDKFIDDEFSEIFKKYQSKKQEILEEEHKEKIESENKEKELYLELKKKYEKS